MESFRAGEVLRYFVDGRSNTIVLSEDKFGAEAAGLVSLALVGIGIAVLRAAAKPDTRYHSRCSGDSFHTTFEDEIRV
ncbi:MAG TPA: hypothetical protein VGO18_28555 [Steroidobacteraceae bacterium]|nr:hypothetical protein [Steroidobacteraceae bacterium]